jgi:hypothetical protein
MIEVVLCAKVKLCVCQSVKQRLKTCLYFLRHTAYRVDRLEILHPLNPCGVILHTMRFVKRYLKSCIVIFFMVYGIHGNAVNGW